MTVDLDLLATHPLFAKLDRGQLESFISAFTESSVAAGHILFEKGSTPTSLLILAEGSVELRAQDPALQKEKDTPLQITAPAPIGELAALDTQSAELVTRSLARTRQDEALYVRGVEQIRRAQRLLNERAKHIRRLLRAEGFERLAAQADDALAKQRTTPGLRRTMRALFDELRYLVVQASTDSARLARQVDSTYTQLRAELSLTVDAPTPFSPAHYRHEMDLLHAEVARWIDSGELLLCPHSTAITRLKRGPLERSRVLLEHLRDDLDGWVDGALAPLVLAVEERKAAAEQRLGRYQRVQRTREALGKERDALVRERAQLAKQLTLLRNIRNAIDHEPGITPPKGRPPFLVVSDGAPVRRLERATEG